MPDTPGSLMRRAATAACLTADRCRPSRRAQSPAPPPPAPEFLTRYDFHLAANVAGDRATTRFSWDDAFRRRSRSWSTTSSAAPSMLVDYQAVLGSEFRPFDPNQGNYMLEASSSFRAPARRKSPACSTTSRGISATGQARSRSPGTCSARARLRRVDVGRRHGRRYGGAGVRRRSIPTSTTRGSPTWTSSIRRADHRARRRVRARARRRVRRRRQRPTGARRPAGASRPACASTAAPARWSCLPASSGASTPIRSIAWRSDWAIAGFRLVSR